MSAYRWITLPDNFNPLNATVNEVASWQRESRWTVHKKIREGIYQSYLDGRIRKIIFASVKADRERAMAAPPTNKRKPGRPRKQPKTINPELRPLTPLPAEAAAAPPAAQPQPARKRRPPRESPRPQ
jgi:hypothetical protein